jgi:E1-E2 ATPase/Cation transporter/ATPase, N-terminus
MQLHEIYKQFDTSLDGLTSQQAKKKRSTNGLNQVPPPLSAPAWLCCLLPCLLATPSMERYNSSVPSHGYVKRNGNWLNMDSESLVPGDIVRVSAGARVPADLRVVEVSTLSRALNIC